MKCPKCGSEVRPSKKYPGYYLCDTCRKRYPEDAVLKSASRPARNRRKKKNKFIPFLLVLLSLVLVIFLGLAYTFDFFGFKNKTNDKSSSSAAEDALSKDKIYKIGETATLHNVKVQVLDYEESEGDEWAAPSEGHHFLFVNLEITNNTEENLAVSSMASFESYCGEYKLDYSSNAFTALATNTDKQLMNGSIAPDKSLSGYLCLEVPNDWTSITIQYSANVWSDEKVTFEIAK